MADPDLVFSAEDTMDDLTSMAAKTVPICARASAAVRPPYASRSGRSSEAEKMKPREDSRNVHTPTPIRLKGRILFERRVRRGKRIVFFLPSAVLEQGRDEVELVHVVAELEHHPEEHDVEAAEEEEHVDNAEVALVLGLARHVHAERGAGRLAAAERHRGTKKGN